MARTTGAEKTIAIVGGGVSGALTAYHLLRNGVPARVVIVDPRPELGLGLAYSTPSLRHLLNVPAAKISALPEQPLHFLNWLRQNYDPCAAPDTFAPRAVFGRYVQSLLRTTQGLQQVQASVVAVEPQAQGALLLLSTGSQLQADTVVLATGNFDPAALPGIDAAAVSSGAYRHDAWRRDAFDGLAEDDSVVLVGTGLTAVDVLLRLRELGHRGTITAVSRHGIFPNRHAAYAPAARPAIPSGTAPTCVAYLRALRATIASGSQWRAAVDSLRASTNDLWLALSTKEQKRFRRHLQRRWDVVRHRMAPPIADAIEAELAVGTLRIEEGHLASVRTQDGGAIVSLRTAGGTREVHAARVINCTGPGMNYRRVQSPLLQDLFAQGIATSGPLGGGFNTTRQGALIGADGLPSSVFFNLGPGRLGTLLESIAIPEIRQQAIEIAAILTLNLSAQQCTVVSDGVFADTQPILVAA